MAQARGGVAARAGARAAGEDGERGPTTLGEKMHPPSVAVSGPFFHQTMGAFNRRSPTESCRGEIGEATLHFVILDPNVSL